jgi:hypothetical protein
MEYGGPNRMADSLCGYSVRIQRILHVSSVDTWWIHFELKIMSLNLRPTPRFGGYWANGECYICIRRVFDNVPRVLVTFGGSLMRESKIGWMIYQL